MKWKIEASLVSISTTDGSDDEASDYKVTVVTPIIEESGVYTIFIEAAFFRDYAFVVLNKVAVQLLG